MRLGNSADQDQTAHIRSKQSDQGIYYLQSLYLHNSLSRSKSVHRNIQYCAGLLVGHYLVGVLALFLLCQYKAQLTLW